MCRQARLARKTWLLLCSTLGSLAAASCGVGDANQSSASRSTEAGSAGAAPWGQSAGTKGARAEDATGGGGTPGATPGAGAPSAAGTTGADKPTSAAGSAGWRTPNVTPCAADPRRLQEQVCPSTIVTGKECTNVGECVACIDGQSGYQACATDASLFQHRFCEGGAWKLDGECTPPPYGSMATVPAGFVAVSGSSSYVPAFEIDLFEVTVAEYRECVQQGGCEGLHFDDGTCAAIYRASTLPGAYFSLAYGALPDAFRGDDQPVVCVDYLDAINYCTWANKQVPYDRHLIRAALGSNTFPWPWGDTAPSCGEVVMDDGGVGCGSGATLPVGSKPNGMSVFGVYDLVGSVEEWATYSRDPSQAGSIGGSWARKADQFIDADSAIIGVLDDLSSDTGIRCARFSAAAGGSGNDGSGGSGASN